jgi:iron complex outermembrane receptor protein
VSNTELPRGNEVPGVPGLAPNADIEWDLPFAPRVALTAHTIHTGEHLLDSVQTLQIDVWTRFDLGARYVVRRPLRSVILRLKSIRWQSSGWASVSNASSAALLQAQPRTVKASISAVP